MNVTTEQFTLGEPQVAGPLAVFPVFGSGPRLDYRSFAQATEVGAFVKELDGGASVGELVIQNPTDLPLLVYEGEEILGAQQNRLFDASVLVDAGKVARLNVSCVEQGRWDASRHGERLRPSPQTADPSLRRLKRVSRMHMPTQANPCAPIRFKSGTRSTASSPSTASPLPAPR